MKDETMGEAKKEAREVKRLTQLALRYLSHRARSRQEIEDYLQKKIKDKSKIETFTAQVLEKIDKFNLLNDLEFSREWTRSKLRSEKGPRLIALQLKKKGISSSVIEKVMEEIEPELWQRYAESRLRKYAKKLTNLEAFKQKARAYRYLTSRGYTPDTIQAIIDDVLPVKVK